MKTNTYLYDNPFQLESGEHFPKLELEYTTLGRLNAEKNNVIWITHALTANSDPSEWWKGLVGKEKFFNPNEHFIICVNVLGSCYGSTGPLSINLNTNNPYYHNFPEITIRDIVNSFDLLRKHLEIVKVHTLIGGSLGGQQAMEWAILQPTIFENLVLIATNPQHSPWGIAFNESQRLAIKSDHTWNLNHPKAGEKGLKTARSIALLSYRNYNTYHKTQQDGIAKRTDFKAASYQNYQGKKLVERFNAFSYYTLTKVMDSHNVGRRRGSVETALKKIKAKTLVIGISSDLLFPVSESETLANGVDNSSLKIIDSLYGHDGFLIETDLIRETLENFYISNKTKNGNK
ncbi:MAG: homoserine O-acetyltransferase family protein [Vicingaceae bacterium]